MAVHAAVGCDTTGCLALYLTPPGQDTAAAMVRAHMAGWDAPVSGTAAHCPSCRRGGLPVLERGECPDCMGSSFSGRHGEVCHHCGHLTPYPPADFPDVDEDQEDDAGDVDRGPRPRAAGRPVTAPLGGIVPADLSHAMLLALLMAHGGSIDLPADAFAPDALAGLDGSWHAVALEPLPDGTFRVSVRSRPDIDEPGLCIE